MQISLSDTSCAFHGKVLSGEEVAGRGEASGARFAHTGARACTLRAPPGPHPPICMHGCSGHFKKKKRKGILCTMGQTRLENYLQILKESSHIYSRVFTELCLTKNCPSRCHREITMHHHCQKESSWSPLWLHHNVGKTHKRNDTPIHEVYDRQRTD